jgi:hypothetical protein
LVQPDNGEPSQVVELNPEDIKTIDQSAFVSAEPTHSRSPQLT